MKISKLLFLSIFISVNIYAQRGSVTNQYLNNMSFNPAYAGENGQFNINGIFGMQFTGASYLPQQVAQNLIVDGQLYNNAALAFQYYRSNYGNINNSGFGLNYSKLKSIGDLHLKFGLDGGLAIANNMIASQTGNQKMTGFAGAGFLASYKGVIVGVSNPMLLASQYILEDKPTYINVGYKFDNDGPFSIYVYGLLKKDFKSGLMATDISAKAWYNDRIALGYFIRNISSNRSGDYYKSAVPFLEYKISNSTNFGLSYESMPPYNNTSSTGAKAPGVFQVMLRYFNIEPEAKSHFMN